MGSLKRAIGPRPMRCFVPVREQKEATEKELLILDGETAHQATMPLQLEEAKSDSVEVSSSSIFVSQSQPKLEVEKY